MDLTPGPYLRLRREAAGKSLEDVAALLTTTPHLHHRDRVEWLASIEADAMPITDEVLIWLIRIEPFRFDAMLLSRLVRMSNGESLRIERICRGCGCSQYDACNDHGRGCSWVDADLCSVCQRKAAA